MKSSLIKSLVATLALTAFGSSLALAGDGKKCSDIHKSVYSQVSKNPDAVLQVVEDALSANEDCACEIVDAAIKASKANSKMVGTIVHAAITTSNAMANTIVECATAAAPDAIKYIEAAYARALKKGVRGGYNLSPVAIGGVYLISPVAPSARGVDTITKVVRVKVDRVRSRTTTPDTSPAGPRIP